MTEAERIGFLIEHLARGNARVFADKIGSSTANVSKMRSGKIGISKSIDKILEAYPLVERSWLETGEGYPGHLSVDLMKAHFQKKIDRQDRLIEYLIEQINELEHLLEVQKECK